MKNETVYVVLWTKADKPSGTDGIVSIFAAEIDAKSFCNKFNDRAKTDMYDNVRYHYTKMVVN